MDSLASELKPTLEDIRGRFLASVKDLRPKLHRFCSRMCGSALDGEDMVQETLAQAFYRLPSLNEQSRLEPWLFKIAHRKCIDFLRSEKKQREDAMPFEPFEEAEGEPISETLAP